MTMNDPGASQGQQAQQGEAARRAQRQRNVRLGLILASIALTFFAGFVAKTMLFPAG
ncbi:hypothetical protein GTZ97_06195 [Aquabacterium fontiphilum]|uniref:cytochrome oxidase small assembly protein n=1 Tax=Aquabacterium fontiphilum TaxID=450365 RepID=UPI001376DB6B|nr:hypothetical protein [Aquabacterium fontiphilum]